MNRFAIVLTFLSAAVFAEEPKVKPAAASRIDAGTLAAFAAQTVELDGGSHAFRLMSPGKVEAGKTYPLVVFLHGAGERGTDNALQLLHFPEFLARPPLREKFPCFLLAPQCAPDQQWVNAPWGDKASTPMAAEPSPMLRRAIAALEKVRRENPVDPKHIYLTGLSMGGYGAWELAMRHPDWFAAVAPICGGGDESRAGVLKDVPVWAFHGDKDTVVWPERSQRMIDALKAAGASPKLTLLPGVGHNAWTPAYDLKSGLLDWMFAQSRK